MSEGAVRPVTAPTVKIPAAAQAALLARSGIRELLQFRPQSAGRLWRASGTRLKRTLRVGREGHRYAEAAATWRVIQRDLRTMAVRYGLHDGEAESASAFG